MAPAVKVEVLSKAPIRNRSEVQVLTVILKGR